MPVKAATAKMMEVNCIFGVVVVLERLMLKLKLLLLLLLMKLKE